VEVKGTNDDEFDLGDILSSYNSEYAEEDEDPQEKPLSGFGAFIHENKYQNLKPGYIKKVEMENKSNGNDLNQMDPLTKLKNNLLSNEDTQNPEN